MTFKTAFHNTVPQSSIFTEEKDSLEWKVDSRGILTVRSAYNKYSGDRMDMENDLEDQSALYRYTVNYFTWLLAKEAVLTHENLNKRKVNLWSRCYLCEEQIEPVNHLFMHNKWTDQLRQTFIHNRKIR